MADYEYYVNCYLGDLIPQKEFASLARQARAYLDQMTRTYLVTGGEDARAMAVCAMAEAIYRANRRQGVTSASIGGVRVQYRQDGALLRQLYRCAGVYLDIRRGKELCKTYGVSSV